MNTLELLESWTAKHKSHAVTIEVDDGYGATCWQVKLHGSRNPNHKFVFAQETSFWEGEREQAPENYVFLNTEEDWPGLEKTILAAIERAEKLGI